LAERSYVADAKELDTRATKLSEEPPQGGLSISGEPFASEYIASSQRAQSLTVFIGITLFGFEQ